MQSVWDDHADAGKNTARQLAARTVTADGCRFVAGFRHARRRAPSAICRDYYYDYYNNYYW